MHLNFIVLIGILRNGSHNKFKGLKNGFLNNSEINFIIIYQLIKYINTILSTAIEKYYRCL